MAVKIISKQKLGDGWERELKGVVNYRKITENAPDLLQIFHVGEDETSFFYTMEAADSASSTEYVPDTLAGRLKKGPLPAVSVFGILSSIFSGIKKIHDAGFAHRDIKPDNILFVKGVPKLGDIGLLSSLNSTYTQIAGTMDFIPPELRIADGSDSSDSLSRKRNDLYAFGKVVYCCVTGLDPHSWPTVPKELPLSLPLKFFLRLSFQLCDRNPARRLDTIGALHKEIAEIERKLMYGEKFRDKVSYGIRRAGTCIRGFMLNLLTMSRKYWIAVCIAVVLAAGGIWHFRPEPSFDITKVTTQNYRNREGAFSLTVPKQWEIFDSETLNKVLGEIVSQKMNEDSLPEIEKKRMEFLLQLEKLGMEYIYCDFDETLPDNITIQTIPLPGKVFMEQSDAELRVNVRKLCQGQLGYETRIYEVRRMQINGVPCIFIDLSHEPEQSRISNYIFMRQDKCFSVAMLAKLSTFAERKEQFSSVIRTIKFDEKP